MYYVVIPAYQPDEKLYSVKIKNSGSPVSIYN